MNKSDYLIQVEKQLSEIFKQTQIGNRVDKLKYRTEGFMHAGRVLGIVDGSELKTLMEKVHFDVFNMTIEEREKMKREMAEQLEEDDYSMMDIPTYIRDMIKKKST